MLPMPQLEANKRGANHTPRKSFSMCRLPTKTKGDMTVEFSVNLKDFEMIALANWHDGQAEQAAHLKLRDEAETHRQRSKELRAINMGGKV